MGHSWSGIRQKLEQDFMCPALRGRVRYHLAVYRKTHDSTGAITVFADGEVLVKGDVFDFYRGYWPVVQAVKAERGVEERYWEGNTLVNNAENNGAEAHAEALRIEAGKFDVWQFTDAVHRFLNSPIETSLTSENPLIRLLAVVDRRVGKRRLKALMAVVDDQPEWLKRLYLMRLEAEGLTCSGEAL